MGAARTAPGVFACEIAVVPVTSRLPKKIATSVSCSRLSRARQCKLRCRGGLNRILLPSLFETRAS